MIDIEQKIAKLKNERDQVVNNAQYAIGVLDGKIQALQEILESDMSGNGDHTYDNVNGDVVHFETINE